MLLYIRCLEGAIVEWIEVIDADDVVPVSKQVVECV